MPDISSLLEVSLLEFDDKVITIGQVASVLLFILLGLLLVLWSGRLLRGFLRKRGVGQDLIQMLSRAFLLVGFIVLGLVTLDILKIPLTAFAFISGAVAIGVGFGAQNIINNFISGWILMWERPIKIGDVLELGELRGSVESINIRSTRIRRIDGVHVLIPNSHLLENIVTNWTHTDRNFRSSIIVGVAHGSDVPLVRKLLEQAADEHERVLKEPTRSVLFDDFGESSLIFELKYWITLSAYSSPRRIQSDLRYKIDSLFRENGVSLSFPQRDVHLDGSISIR